jgi:YHS domain-containing protein
MISCSLCGKTIEESNSIIDEVIEGKYHAFDNEGCLLMFRKLESVYGKEYFIIEC